MSDPWVEFLSRGGAVAILALVAVGFVKEWWVSGSAHRRLRHERDELFDLALCGTSGLERAVRTAKRATLAEEDAIP